MSTPRDVGSGCPLDAERVSMDKCQPCPYFRGAVLATGMAGWRITCNWPRNGSHIDPNTDLSLPAFDPGFWNSALE